jgi:uncharacterized protein (DUF2141 family)
MLKISRWVRLSTVVGVALSCAIASSSAYAGQVIPNDPAKCASDGGPAVMVEVRGFSTNGGKLRVQSYHATKGEWLQKGRWISRIEAEVRPAGGMMRVCMPLPAAGRYGIAVRHDVDGNGKTDLTKDGGGFSNNPKATIFNLGKPSVDKVTITVGQHPTSIAIRLQYM